MGMLTLKILSSKGEKQTVSCDSVHLIIAEDAKGNQGGSYGIRPGHIRSLVALGCGDIKAYVKGEEILRTASKGGFATVEKDVVTCVIN